MNIEIQPEVQDRLAAKAKASGVALERFIESVLNREALGVPEPDSSAAQLLRDQAYQDILKHRKGSVLGPGLTVRDLIEEGRRF